MKATPDGYVLGFMGAHWVYGTLDYGKTWNRLESWVNMSMPQFIDRQRGYMVAAELSMTGSMIFKVRRTEDGGKTWATGETTAGYWNWLAGPVVRDRRFGALYRQERQVQGLHEPGQNMGLKLLRLLWYWSRLSGYWQAAVAAAVPTRAAASRSSHSGMRA